MKTEKIILGLFVILLIGGASFLMQSCSSHNDESASCNTPIAVISESDEFVDFTASSNSLAEKFLAYTKTLSQTEFDELMYNLNNDEYMSEVVTKAGIEKDILLLSKYKSNLLNNTDYLKLDKSEQANLFTNFSDKIERIRMKTRRESEDVDECEKRRMEDYSWARAIADLGLIGCTCTVEIPIVACLCYAAVMANYANDIRLADRAYEDCIKSTRK